MTELVETAGPAKLADDAGSSSSPPASPTRPRPGCSPTCSARPPSARSRAGDADVEVVELRPLAHALTDHLLTGFPAGELAAAVEAVAGADARDRGDAGVQRVVLRAVQDVLRRARAGYARGTPVLVAATAGTARHTLVLEHALRPLFSYLHAVVVPTGVFAASEDWGASRRATAARARVDRAAGELAALVEPRGRARRGWTSSTATSAAMG